MPKKTPTGTRGFGDTLEPYLRRKSQYRIRWANIQARNGRTIRMCIAESKVRLLCFSWWWPVQDSRWRQHEHESLSDIAHDKDMRAPLPATRYV